MPQDPSARSTLSSMNGITSDVSTTTTGMLISTVRGPKDQPPVPNLPRISSPGSSLDCTGGIGTESWKLGTNGGGSSTALGHGSNGRASGTAGATPRTPRELFKNVFPGKRYGVR